VAWACLTDDAVTQPSVVIDDPLAGKWALAVDAGLSIHAVQYGAPTEGAGAAGAAGAKGFVPLASSCLLAAVDVARKVACSACADWSWTPQRTGGLQAPGTAAPGKMAGALASAPVVISLDLQPADAVAASSTPLRRVTYLLLTLGATAAAPGGIFALDLSPLLYPDLYPGRSPADIAPYALYVPAAMTVSTPVTPVVALLDGAAEGAPAAGVPNYRLRLIAGVSEGAVLCLDATGALIPAGFVLNATNFQRMPVPATAPVADAASAASVQREQGGDVAEEGTAAEAAAEVAAGAAAGAAAEAGAVAEAGAAAGAEAGAEAQALTGGSARRLVPVLSQAALDLVGFGFDPVAPVSLWWYSSIEAEDRQPASAGAPATPSAAALPVFRRGQTGWVTSGPVSDGRSVLGATEDGYVFALDAENGGKLWTRRHTKFEVGANIIADRFGRTMFASGDGRAIVLTARSSCLGHAVGYVLISVVGALFMVTALVFHCVQSCRARNRLKRAGPSVQFVDSAYRHIKLLALGDVGRLLRTGYSRYLSGVTGADADAGSRPTGPLGPGGANTDADRKRAGGGDRRGSQTPLLPGKWDGAAKKEPATAAGAAAAAASGAAETGAASALVAATIPADTHMGDEDPEPVGHSGLTVSQTDSQTDNTGSGSRQVAASSSFVLTTHDWNRRLVDGGVLLPRHGPPLRRTQSADAASMDPDLLLCEPAHSPRSARDALMVPPPIVIRPALADLDRETWGIAIDPPAPGLLGRPREPNRSPPPLPGHALTGTAAAARLAEARQSGTSPSTGAPSSPSFARENKSVIRSAVASSRSDNQLVPIGLAHFLPAERGSLTPTTPETDGAPTAAAALQNTREPPEESSPGRFRSWFSSVAGPASRSDQSRGSTSRGSSRRSSPAPTYASTGGIPAPLLVNDEDLLNGHISVHDLLTPHGPAGDHSSEFMVTGRGSSSAGKKYHKQMQQRMQLHEEQNSAVANGSAANSPAGSSDTSRRSGTSSPIVPSGGRPAAGKPSGPHWTNWVHSKVAGRRERGSSVSSTDSNIAAPSSPTVASDSATAGT
jgi:hypothetical protein